MSIHCGLEAVLRNGDVIWINGAGFGAMHRTGDAFKAIPLPCQDVAALFEVSDDGASFLPFAWPGGLEVFDAVESKLIDVNTGTAITKAVHPFCGTNEQIGITRNALVILFNALGIEAPDDLVAWNEIAIAEIEAAKAAKDA